MPPAVVFDIGSQNFRAGVADLESEVPTHDLHQTCDGSSTADASWPIERGQVVNWANMEALLAKMYYQQLQLVPEGPNPPSPIPCVDLYILLTLMHTEHCLVIAERPLLPTAEREKMTQIVFETFNGTCDALLMSFKVTTMAKVLHSSIHGSACISPIR